MRLGLLVLIGLPGCGKTTLAKALLKGSENQGDNTCHFIHICYDEILRFPNGNYESEWKSVRNSLLVKIEQFLVALKMNNIDSCPPEFRTEFPSASSSDIVLIIDDNMYFKSMRYSLFQIARKQNTGFCQLYLKCSLENALLKNSLRGSDSIVPSQIIENMHSKLEPPNQRNNWEKYSLELDAFCDFNNVQCKIFQLVNQSLDNFMYESDDSEMRELSKIQCSKSVLHQTDIALRKLVGVKVKNYRENCINDSKGWVASLNCKKSEILSDIKKGIICLPEAVLDEINSGAIEKFELINFLDSYF